MSFYEEAGQNTNINDPLHTGIILDKKIAVELYCNRPPKGYEILERHIKKSKRFPYNQCFLVFKAPNNEIYGAMADMLHSDVKIRGEKCDSEGWYPRVQNLYMRLEKIDEKCKTN